MKCGGVIGVLVLALMCSGCHRAPVAEDLEVVASLSTNRIRIGDPVVLTVRTVHPQTTRVEWPPLDRRETLIVRDRDERVRSVSRERVMSEVRWVLTSLTVGEHIISTQAVIFVTGEGARVERPFPLLSLTVESVLTNETVTLRPSKDLMRWPAAVPRWAVVLATIAVVATALGILAARYLKRPATAPPPPPPVPPDVVALEELKRLRESGTMTEEQAERFYVELTGIVRRYIEARFGLRAPERTTEEFIREASESGALAPAHQELVRAFLEHSDLVKFARFRPSLQQMEDAFRSAERLVLESRLTPPPPTS